MVHHFRELRVYQHALSASTRLFNSTKAWPREEQYALTDQIRRSSRSVCANIAEAWRKRRYPKHFVSKLTDADAEASETQSWLDVAHQCGYLNDSEFKDFDSLYDNIIATLVGMMKYRDRWCGPVVLREDPDQYHTDPDNP